MEEKAWRMTSQQLVLRLTFAGALIFWRCGRPLASALLHTLTYNQVRDAGYQMAAQQQPLDEVIRRVQGEYIEMPGLRLTTAQAQRLWGLDRTACDTLLSALVDAKFLFQTRDGAFVRSDQVRTARL